MVEPRGSTIVPVFGGVATGVLSLGDGAAGCAPLGAGAGAEVEGGEGGVPFGAAPASGVDGGGLLRSSGVGTEREGSDTPFGFA